MATPPYDPRLVEAIEAALDEYGRMDGPDDGCLYICLGPPWCSQVEDPDECVWCHVIYPAAHQHPLQIEGEIARRKRGH